MSKEIITNKIITNCEKNDKGDVGKVTVNVYHREYELSEDIVIRVGVSVENPTINECLSFIKLHVGDLVSTLFVYPDRFNKDVYECLDRFIVRVEDIDSVPGVTVKEFSAIHPYQDADDCDVCVRVEYNHDTKEYTIYKQDNFGRRYKFMFKNIGC